MTARPFKLTQPEPSEAVVQRAVLHALRLHPSVAWVERMNTGVFRPMRKDGSTGFVRAGFVGLADVIGQMRTGAFLAVEVKKPTGRISEAQAAFLDRVRGSGGVAFVARGIDDVIAALAPAAPMVIVPYTDPMSPSADPGLEPVL